MRRLEVRLDRGDRQDVIGTLAEKGGGSPQGARPKVVVAVNDKGRAIAGTTDVPDGYRHDLVKFPGREDPPDIGAVEASYAAMAEEAGIDVPPTTLFANRDGGRHFAAERFDRRDNQRIHMHTLGGLLHASHRLPSVEYEGFLRAISPRVFRRPVRASAPARSRRMWWLLN